MRGIASRARARGQSTGLVPTMGALHEGHLSLVRRAAAENSLTVVSVFVNPIQFDDQEDLASYPGTLADDAEAAFSAGADIVFAPSAKEMYPEGFSTYVDMTGVSGRLCGASRASHFRGVLTVVSKLFGICMPDRAYFGEKDAQQLAVVQKMAAELCMNVEVIGCPTVREGDGLAMSSRNARLSAQERASARCLYRALCEAKACFSSGETDAGALTATLRAVIEKETLPRIDYVEIVDPFTFEAVPVAREGDLIALAVYFGETRLIDNMRL
ncbi:MAG: pantoate--beta-alanine ligase [Clostridiales bacterium]|nr:pantoate--beta-alanine ligase [Clostridiales bacterium]